jgi:predicted lipoprotein with Yx(FWY)xxD motif
MGAGFTSRTAAVSTIAAVFAGVALAAPAPVLVETSTNALGTPTLVSPKGLTLYHYLREGRGTIKCTGACAVLFPPLLVGAGAKPVAGPGLSAAKLSTIKRPDGRLQVTYDGLPLYFDIYDKPAVANGQGQQGVWFAVTPAGTVTKARPTAPTRAAPSASQPASNANVAAAGTPGVARGATATNQPPPREDLGCGVMNNASLIDPSGNC